MIPKIIHYCWFGHNQKPDSALRCINSWRKNCPDYQIVEWNEDNFDISICQYVNEAYREKKWAFVSDYARLWILYNYGGLYFDVDVELIRPIDDIVSDGCFMAFERNVYGEDGRRREDFSGVGVNPGLGIGAEKGNSIYKEILEDYNHRHFIRDDKKVDMTSIVDTVTLKLMEYGLSLESKKQIINGIVIYPVDYFGAMNYYTGKIKITDNTRTIHHYAASWVPKKSQGKQKMRHTIIGLLGTEKGTKIYALLKRAAGLFESNKKEE